MQKNPKLIGVTGGIGSGKSIVCRLFETLRSKVYYADDRAKYLMLHDESLKTKIQHLFGTQAYIGGALNKGMIAAKAFDNPQILTRLNAVVHPAVAVDFESWIKVNAGERLLFYETALLFETKSYRKMDATVLVSAPTDLRIKRVLKRDRQRSMESVEKIIQQQMPENEKVKLADYRILNDGTKSVINQAMEVYGLF